jgi:hypothetical protein
MREIGSGLVIEKNPVKIFLKKSGKKIFKRSDAKFSGKFFENFSSPDFSEFLFNILLAVLYSIWIF